MKQYLILTALISQAAWGAPPTVPVQLPPAQQAPQQVQQVQATKHGSPTAGLIAAPRRLTPEQLAELRRQIIQYSPSKKK